MSENRLFVGNLSYQTLENDLTDLFSQAGAVASVNLMFDKFTGKSRGFAFVEFSSSEEAIKAVEMFHNVEFQGRALSVNVAPPGRNPPRVKAATVVVGAVTVVREASAEIGAAGAKASEAHSTVG